MLHAGLRAPAVELGPRLADGRWQLLDGFHRLAAEREEGATHVEAMRRRT
jgi:ParB-like chromosome segregation protein Spo0J